MLRFMVLSSPQTAAPASLEGLVQSLPPAARASLAWLPAAFRAQVVEPLRSVEPAQFRAAFAEVVVPGVQLLLRSTTCAWPLLQAADLQAEFEQLRDRALANIGRILEAKDVKAADALREAFAWLIALMVAANAEFREELAADTEGKLAQLKLEELDIEAELRTPAASLLRGLLLTLSAYEAILLPDDLPPALGVWADQACAEVHAAANILRSQGLAVPSSLPAGIGEAAWRLRRRSSLFRRGVLPPGTLAIIRGELSPKQLWLFGSRAKGTHGPESDWDVLAVVADDLDVGAALDAPTFSRVRRAGVDLTVVTESEFEEGKSAFGSLVNIAVTEGILLG